MVHRSGDSRLLSNLITHERDYTKHLQSLLDISHASFNSLSAYAASSPPPASQVILSVAGSLSNADNALRGYAGAVEEWARYLKELKDLEDEVGNIIRDREILVTRLLKASKASAKTTNSNRDSFTFPSSLPASSSTSSLKSTEDPSTTYGSTSFFSSITPGSVSANKKLQLAQSELQACEAHLAKKESELDLRRSTAIRDGLRVRFRALAQCGWMWTQVGKEVEVVLGIDPVILSPPASGKTLPDLHSPVPVHANPPIADFNDRPSSDLSSIAPSQSASQVNSPPLSPGSVSHIYSDLEVASLSFPAPALPHAHAAETSISLQIPPAHSIDELTGPPLVPDADLTITRNQRRHVLPHRITEEDLGFRAGMLDAAAAAAEGNIDNDGSEDEEDEDEYLPSDAQVVENPRFSSKNQQSHSQSSLTKTKGRNMTTSTMSPTTPTSSKFFGSLRGLFTRHGKERERNRGDQVLVTDDSNSESEIPTKGGAKSGKGLRGRNKKKTARTLFSDDEDGDGGNESILSSPPALRITTNGSASGNKISPVSAVFPFRRGRTMSDIHRISPQTQSDAGGGKKLKKSHFPNGTGVGPRPRGTTMTSDLDPGVVRQRRRSASLDDRDLSVGSRNKRISQVRAEEWVNDGLNHADVEGGSEAREAKVGNGEEVLRAQRSNSVKRRRSANRKSLPASASAPASGSGSGSTTTNALVVVVPSLPNETHSPSTSVSRASSVKSSTSANAAGAGPVKTQLYQPRSGSLDLVSSSYISPSTSASSSAITLTQASVNHHGNGLSTTKAQRRVSSPVTAVGLSEGSVSLMSIVEDVAKANREAWSGASKGSGGAGVGAVGKSLGGTIKPIGMLEVVKAPRGIDLQDLKEQMDRDLGVQQQQQHHQHSGHQNGNAHHGNGQARATSRPRSGSASAAIRDSSRERDREMSSSVSAPMLPLPVASADSIMAGSGGRASPSFKPGAGPLLPLKSALKNPSRTPSPMSSSSQGTSSQMHQQHQQQHQQYQTSSYVNGNGITPRVASPLAKTIVPTVPVSVSVPMGNGDVQGKDVFDGIAASGANGISSPPLDSDSDSDSGSDAASISSYETGLEGFDGDSGERPVDSGDETETGQGHDSSMYPLPPLSHLHNGAGKGLLSGYGNDISSGESSVSAETQTRVRDDPVAATLSTPPKRRKSVRVSLQPTFSTTPPAIEYEEVEEEEGGKGQGGNQERRVNGYNWGSTNSHSTTIGSTTDAAAPAPDVWADSSDEDVEYQQAKKLLSRFSSNSKKPSDGGQKTKVKR